MEIRVGGRVWDVETAASRSLESGQDFCGITFRDRSDLESEVAIGWVPAAAHLTSASAARLFELAGERHWRDPRTGMVHRVVLEDGGGEVGAPLGVSFQTTAGSYSTRYDVEVALGMAEDQDLERLLDRALRRGPRRPGAA